MKDQSELLMEMHATLARMDERGKANAEKLDALARLGEGHTVLFEKHAERIGALESMKAKLLAAIAGVSVGGSAVGAKVASLFTSTTTQP